jgi:hypothetical protein
VPAVQVHHGGHRQLVAVPDPDRLAAAALDRRSGEDAVVAEHGGARPGQDLHLGHPLDDLDQAIDRTSHGRHR